MTESADRERQRRASAPRYRSWLLRRWASKGAGVPTETTWRYSLEDPQTGMRRGFTNLADLVAYLQAEPGEGEAVPRRTG